MTEPTPVQPAPAQPFNPAAVARPRGGCSKPLLLGCAALFVLLGVGMVVFVVKMPDVLSWLFRQWESQIMAQVPADVTPAERERLHRAFAASIAALRSQPVDPAKLKPVQMQITQIMEMGNAKGKLTREDVLRLTVALESLGGVARPEKPSTAAPSTGTDLGTDLPPPGTDLAAPAAAPSRVAA